MAAASMGEVSASIVAGPPATLVNVSAGGALLEVASRIPLRGSVRLRLTMPTGERIQVEGSLAWARVAKIAGGQVTYRIAVEFTRPIAALATSEVDASEVEAEVIDAQETGAEEQAPRTEALERELAATSADLACQTALIETLAARLEAAIRMRKTASAEWKRERERWEDERARLIQQLAAATARADALQARVDAQEREHGEAEHMRDDDEPT